MIEMARDLLTTDDISPDFKGSTRQEKRIIQALLKKEATPQAVTYFAKHCDKLSDYWYWFTLSTLWVSYTGWSDLDLWRRLFSSNRPNRESSIMKPSERAGLKGLDEVFAAYRAHRPGEKDWIAYTLHPIKAGTFAMERGVNRVDRYAIHKKGVLALFLRRGEYEILVLDHQFAKHLDYAEVKPVAPKFEPPT